MDENRDVTEVIFEATGADPRILDLSRTTASPPYGPPKTMGAGEPPVHYAAVHLVETNVAHEAAFERVREWLGEHHDLIRDIHGEKCIEFQTVLLPGDGSRAITFPVDILKRCADAGVQLRNQYARVVADEERPAQ